MNGAGLFSVTTKKACVKKADAVFALCKQQHVAISKPAIMFKERIYPLNEKKEGKVTENKPYF